MSNDTNDGNHHDGDVAFIQSLADLLNARDLAELSVKREYGEHDRLTVSLSKHGKQVTVQSSPVHAAPAAAAPAATAPSAQGQATGGDPSDLPGAVTSPMVGTVYLAAEPGAAAFVQIGQQVSEGDTLLIVEAMKTMNHIPSPRAGTVKRILVDDGTPVEFGAPLMVVE